MVRIVVWRSATNKISFFKWGKNLDEKEGSRMFSASGRGPTDTYPTNGGGGGTAGWNALSLAVGTPRPASLHAERCPAPVYKIRPKSDRSHGEGTEPIQ